MAKRERYQNGCLLKKTTALGPCWFIRFYVPQEDGSRKRIQQRVGLLKDLPTKKQAFLAAEELRRAVNRPQLIVQERRMRDVVERYMREEMPTRYSTAKGYRNLLLNHIRPEWGDSLLSDITGEKIRRWLRSMDCSPKSRGHRRDMLRVLFNNAIFWKWYEGPANPAESFRLEDVTKRSRPPVVLTAEQFARLLKHPMLREEPYRTMCILAACTGLRCSELFGLQWRDVRWQDKLLMIERAVVEGREDRVKTVHSEKPLPLQDEVLQVLRFHLHSVEFKNPTDWIFASPHSAGAKGYHASGIQRYRIRVAAREQGLPNGVG